MTTVTTTTKPNTTPGAVDKVRVLKSISRDIRIPFVVVAQFEHLFNVCDLQEALAVIKAPLK